jgi:uncharacterized protein DUF3108
MRFRLTMAFAALWLAMLPNFGQGQATPPIPIGSSVSAAPSAQIVPPPPSYRFPDGQAFVFGVEWHLFTAGSATVKLESAGSEQHVTTFGDSAGVVSVLFKVHDRFDSAFDAKTFCSLRVNKHTEEGKRQHDTAVRFDYVRRKSVLNDKNLKTGESKQVENDIPGCVTDVLSGFYYLASLPLQPGNTYTFPLNDGGKTTEVVATVEAPEQVKVPAGTFQTVRVKAEPVSGPLKGKGSAWIWFTDDPNHTAVQMRSKLGWGTLLFRLQRIEKQ